MTREAVKAWELRAVQELIRRLELEIQAEDPETRESPDFELRFRDGSAVGVEVTELADPSIASGDAAVTRLRTELERRLDDLGLLVGVGLRIGEGFAFELARDGQRVRDHVDGLVLLVQDHAQARRRPRWYRHDTLYKRGIPFVLEVWIGEGAGGVITSGSAVGRRAPFVQQCIDRKSAKIAEYRARLPGRPIWLLLVAGVAGRSAVWSIVLDGHAYSSVFERTFYLDAYDGRFIELNR